MTRIIILHDQEERFRGLNQILNVLRCYGVEQKRCRFWYIQIKQQPLTIIENLGLIDLVDPLINAADIFSAGGVVFKSVLFVFLKSLDGANRLLTAHSLGHL